MAIHITASGATSIGLADNIIITVGLGYTGSLTVTNAGSTQYGTASGTQLIVTDPVKGNEYRIGGLRNQGAISINPSTTTDLAVTKVPALR